MSGRKDNVGWLQGFAKRNELFGFDSEDDVVPSVVAGVGVAVTVTLSVVLSEPLSVVLSEVLSDVDSDVLSEAASVELSVVLRAVISVGTDSENIVVSVETSVTLTCDSPLPFIYFAAKMIVPAIIMHIPAIRSAVIRFSLRFLLSDNCKTPLSVTLGTEIRPPTILSQFIFFNSIMIFGNRSVIMFGEMRLW